MDPRPTVRTITVGGEGEVQVVPDLARVVFNVETTHAELARAQAENASRLAAVIAHVKALGVMERDLQTSGYGVRPQHDSNRQGRLIGYQAVNGVRVTVRDLTKLPELLDGAVAAGANLVHGVQFDVADKEGALRRARDRLSHPGRGRRGVGPGSACAKAATWRYNRPGAIADRLRR